MRHSLRYKIVSLLVVFAVLLAGVSVLVSYRTVDKMNDHHYLSKANEIAATLARVIDTDDAARLRDDVAETYYAAEDKVRSDEWGSPAFEAYVGRFAWIEDTESYQNLMAVLSRLQEVNDVDCLYLVWLDPTEEGFVYILDAALEDPCPVGCIDPLYEFNRGVLTEPMLGFPAYITNTEEYGWLVTAGAPVVDEAGEVLCYAMVDISMDDIKAQEMVFLTGLVIALLILTALLSAAVIWYVNRSVIKPVNLLSRSAESYTYLDSTEHNAFQDLNINTGDEIESLHKSMIQMEKDLDTYVDNLVKTRQVLVDTRKEAEHLSELAQKDALTGLRNKLAYDQEMARLEMGREDGKTQFGVAMIDMNDLKKINDRYGHDCGNDALATMSRLICNVFLHSPVFRIGGDEFAVILQGNDYDKIEELDAAFRAAVAAQEQAAEQPWQAVSAAVGYALYDPELDYSADDVFRRADQKMYEQKKQMKVGR